MQKSGHFLPDTDDLFLFGQVLGSRTIVEALDITSAGVAKVVLGATSRSTIVVATHILGNSDVEGPCWDGNSTS